MRCVDCGEEKTIEKINVLIYDRNICQDCVDYDQNMRLARETEERFKKGFDITCLKCGNDDCKVISYIYKGNAEHEIQCSECGQVD